MESMSLMGNTGSGLRAWSKGGWPIQCTSGHVSEQFIEMCKAPHTCIYICIHRGYLVFWLVVVFFMCWMALWQGPGGQVGAACCMPSTGKMPILGDINRCQSWVLAFLMLATKTRRRKEKVFVITFHS